MNDDFCRHVFDNVSNVGDGNVTLSTPGIDDSSGARIDTNECAAMRFASFAVLAVADFDAALPTLPPSAAWADAKYVVMFHYMVKLKEKN